MKTNTAKQMPMESRLDKRRSETKTYLDLPLSNRISDLINSEAGKFLKNALPHEIYQLVQQTLIQGTDSEFGQQLKTYLLGSDDNGTVSMINRMVDNNWKDPEVFKYIYRIDQPDTKFDNFYIQTTGAIAIHNRLTTLIRTLPRIVDSERKRQGLKEGQLLLIDNIGSGHALDTLGMLKENPELARKVHVRCIDPDQTTMNFAKAKVRELGLENSFEFIGKPVQNVPTRNAHMLLMIGMFCPVPTTIFKKSIDNLKIFCRPDGIIIFSTVQEKMLQDGPLLDMMMELQGWHMYFKTETEPDDIAREVGWIPEESFVDDYQFNKMTIARLPKKERGNVLRLIKRAASSVRCLLV
jgi:hypothetical protein